MHLLLNALKIARKYSSRHGLSFGRALRESILRLEFYERNTAMSAKPPVNAVATRQFKASPQRVMDAWLIPDSVRQWMTLNGDDVVNVSTDPRVGGAFSFVVRRKGTEIDHFGKYVELDRPRHVVFTWAARELSQPPESVDASRVSIDVAPAGSGATVTITHELHPDWSHFAERAAGSWTKMLNAIAAALGEPAQ
jgi:uncharacterized protein YndB with AHSA1/START domain